VSTKRQIIGCNIVPSRCLPGGMCVTKRRKKDDITPLYSTAFQERVKLGAAQVAARLMHHSSTLTHSPAQG